MGRITRNQLSIHIAQVIQIEVKYFFHEDLDVRLRQYRLFLSSYRSCFQFQKAESVVLEQPDDSDIIESTADLFIFPKRFKEAPKECAGFTEEALGEKEHDFGVLFMRYILLLEVYQYLPTISDQASHQEFAVLKSEMKVAIANVFSEFQSLFQHLDFSLINPDWFYFIEEYTLRGLKNGEAFKKALLGEFRETMQHCFKLLVICHLNKKPNQDLIMLVFSLSAAEFIDNNIEWLYPKFQDANEKNVLLASSLKILFYSTRFSILERSKNLEDVEESYCRCYEDFLRNLTILAGCQDQLSLPLVHKITELQQGFEYIHRNPWVGRSFGWFFLNEVECARDLFFIMSIGGPFMIILLTVLFWMQNCQSATLFAALGYLIQSVAFVIISFFIMSLIFMLPDFLRNYFTTPALPVDAPRSLPEWLSQWKEKNIQADRSEAESKVLAALRDPHGVGFFAALDQGYDADWLAASRSFARLFEDDNSMSVRCH